MITAGALNIGQTGATLSGSYSGASETPREVRIEYGTSSGNLKGTAYYNDGGLNAGSGSWSVNLTSLQPGTTYYYRAVIEVGGKDYCGSEKCFTTASATQVTFPSDWLELPATVSGGSIDSGWFVDEDGTRNYSYQYDETTSSCLWAAYPLTKAYMSGDATSTTWRYNPDIPQDKQIGVTGSSYESMYNANYSRGHLVPAGDRKCSTQMRRETFYVTNQVPQIQNEFNGSIWGSLETALRNLVSSSSTETIYVVTGPSYRKVGGSESIKYINAASSSTTPASVPIANYFWKAVLKVKRDASGNVTSASAVGFWFEHKEYSNSSYANYAVSVDQIEAWTGLDLFHNLPDSIESACETNTSWSSFQSF